jgi:hypothetical protein
VRRLFRPIERFFLGILMTLIALVVERRLRARQR